MNRDMNHGYTVAKRKIAAERLLILAEYLRNVKPAKFDLHSWGDIDTDKLKPVTKTQANQFIREGACGTTACACGHAASIPKFRRLGLLLEVDAFSIRGQADDVDINIDVDFVYQNPRTRERYIGIEAAEKFFFLDNDEAARLFDPMEYPNGRRGKSYVIHRIEAKAKSILKENAALQRNAQAIT